MTGLLKQTLTERANAEQPPPVDIDAIIRTGDRRLRRRRTLGALGAAALVATVLSTGITVGRGLLAGPEPAGPTSFAADEPVWALGKEIHYGGKVIRTSESVDAFVRTDAGFVYADKDGNITVTDGRRSERVGKHFRHQLVADGTRAAWVEVTGPATLEQRDLVVFDVRAWRTVSRSRTVADASADGSHTRKAAEVLALDGRDLYVLAGRDTRGEVIRRDVVTGRSEFFATDMMLFEDARAGWYTHRVPDTPMEHPEVVTARSMTATGPVYPGNQARVSPHGQYVATVDFYSKLRVFDVRTKQERRIAIPGHSYTRLPYWLTDDVFVTVALRGHGYEWVHTAPTVVDLLECRVSTGSCSVAAAGVVDVLKARGFGDIRLADGKPM